MKLYKIIAGISMLLILPILCLPVFSAGETETLDLKCSTKISGKRYYFAGDEFSILKIADATVSDENGQLRIFYKTLPEYSALDCNWGNLTAEQMRKKASALGKLATSADEYCDTEVIDAQGNASFTGLEKGLYLVVRTKVASKNQSYVADPFLISLPMIWDGKFEDRVLASPKYGWNTAMNDHSPNPQRPPSDGSPPDGSSPDGSPPDTPMQQLPAPEFSNSVSGALKLPQTGQLNWPIPVLLVIGGLLIFIGYKQSKQKQDK